MHDPARLAPEIHGGFLLTCRMQPQMLVPPLSATISCKFITGMPERVNESFHCFRLLLSFFYQCLARLYLDGDGGYMFALKEG